MTSRLTVPRLAWPRLPWPRLPWRRLLWPLLGIEAAVATGVAATPWLRAYHVSGAPGVLAAAAVASVATSLFVAVGWGKPAVPAYGLSLAVLVVLLLATVSLDPVVLARGLIHGPSYLLTATLPLTNPRWQLVAPVVLTWASGAVASELLARGRGSGAPIAVLLISYTGAYALSSSAPGQGAAEGALLLVALAVLAMSRRFATTMDLTTVAAADGSSTGASRALAGWVALAVTVAGFSWLVVPVLPGMGHGHAGIDRAVPTQGGLALAPVEAIAALRDDQPQAAPVALFRVQTDVASTGYFMLATLDQYDGDVWSFDRTFQPSGGRVPSASPDAPVSAATTSVPNIGQRYTILRRLGPLGPFLPYLDRPVDVTGVAIDVDDETGMIVPSAVAGTAASYSVDSRAPAQTLDRLPPASAVAPDADGSDRQLPAGVGTDLTGVLRYLAAVTGQRPAPTIPFLQAVVAALKTTDRRIDPASIPAGGTDAVPTRGGTSLSEVINAVTASQQATPEQFATLVVLVARSLGVPARLATGFRVPDGAAPGPHLVTNRQAWTWAEIPVAGIGWVVADPTPALTAGLQPPTASGVQSTSTTVAPPAANAVPGNVPGSFALAPPAHLAPPPTRHHSLPRAIGIAILLVAVVLAAAVITVFAVAAARRAIRRRLRRSAEPTALAVGAWLELLDDLWCVGVVAGAGATTAEVAELAAEELGPAVREPVRQVGEVADQALYSSLRAVDGAAASSAWRTERALGRQLRSQLTPRRRTRVALSVGRAPRRPAARSSDRPAVRERAGRVPSGR